MHIKLLRELRHHLDAAKRRGQLVKYRRAEEDLARIDRRFHHPAVQHHQPEQGRLYVYGPATKFYGGLKEITKKRRGF